MKIAKLASPFGWRCRKRLEPLLACDKTQRPQLFAVQINFYNREDQEKRDAQSRVNQTPYVYQTKV